MNKDVTLRLIQDVRQDKWHGNPFRYLLDEWTEGCCSSDDCLDQRRMGRGQLLLEAANETYGGYVTEGDVKDLATAWDMWSKLQDEACPFLSKVWWPVLSTHGSQEAVEKGRSKLYEEYLAFAEPVVTMLGIGLPDKDVRTLVESLWAEQCEFRKDKGRALEFLSLYLDQEAQRLKAEHEAALESLEESRQEELQERRGWDS